MRRRAGERLLIGAEIEIEILEVGPTRVKLGITAPTTLAIARKEVLLTREENLSAARHQHAAVQSWLGVNHTAAAASPVNLLTLSKEITKNSRNG